MTSTKRAQRRPGGPLSAQAPQAARSLALVPLRLFLGVTFTFAGLQKMANPAYLNGHSPLSVQSTIHSLQHQSPIGFLLQLSSHAPALVGVLIALGELAVGLATLLGLWVRVAAIGGFLLAATFFLTVSWRTRPYYYGSDIVFMAAWTVPLLKGAWDGPTVDEWIRRRAARDADPQRRALVVGGAAAGVLAATTGALAALVAMVGRALNNSGTATAVRAPSPSTSPTSQGSRSSRRSKTRQPAASGPVITAASAVPAGSAVQFEDPSTGPAWLVHEQSGDFRAFSAVCTHAGCTVEFDQSGRFICPCHGGEYDAATGAVLGGPPPSPLPAISVNVADGNVRLG